MESSERSIPHIIRLKGKVQLAWINTVFIHLTPRKDVQPSHYIKLLFTSILWVHKIYVLQPVKVNSISWSVFTGASFTMSIKKKAKGVKKKHLFSHFKPVFYKGRLYLSSNTPGLDHYLFWFNPIIDIKPKYPHRNSPN